MKEKVLVLGAGIQGISCALALRASGYAVTLLDQCHEPFSRTSFCGEAKIHLGYVYANDSSFQTASLLLKAAMHFAPLLDRWTDNQLPWADLCSTPFTYVVHRNSMLAPDALIAHYNRIGDQYQEYKLGGLHYLGQHPEQLLVKSQALPASLNPDFAQASIQTQETALHTAEFGPLLSQIVKQKGVCLRMNRKIESVERTASGFRVRGRRPDGTSWSEEGGIVVNCLWDGRLQIDASLGIKPARNWVYRLKYRLLGHLPITMKIKASYTVVLGPFGDLVTYPNGLTYVSWYPTCMRGWSTELQPPPEWEAANPGPQNVDQIPWLAEALQEFNAIFPGLRHFEVKKVDAGVIFSWGETDIDDPVSELHRRYNIGVNSFDGYFSIDTGKFTCAPMFARELLDYLS
ncbi:FAD-dependent oxidoreductase [Larkinella sp. VNQ87]|uniref:FAD-dependent oxidoreductase n=1 Tax=Larkinella sp. VNQ87 TaxID=3400921 RepID=UPI003BFDC07F